MFYISLSFLIFDAIALSGADANRERATSSTATNPGSQRCGRQLRVITRLRPGSLSPEPWIR